MNIATNLPELPTNNESKFTETVKENIQFFKKLTLFNQKNFYVIIP